ncbi:MAG: pyridoxamine 5'-phosphate oxidase family protein, partial [Thermoplasmata archaeon]
LKRMKKFDKEVKRYSERAHYDRDSLYSIIDDSIFCVVSFCMEGLPYAIPMNFARLGDYIYIHGSCNTRIIENLKNGAPASVSITIPGEPVISDKLCNYSMNYKSAIIYGRFENVERPEEKIEFFLGMAKKLNPLGWRDSIRPDKNEIENVCVIKLKIEEFSVKTRD